MKPPSLTSTTTSGRTTQAATTRETLLRNAIRLMATSGLARSHAWTRQVVRDYCRSSVRGFPFGDYLAARLQLSAQQRAELYASSEYRNVLCYSDPTGETAVRNVMGAS